METKNQIIVNYARSILASSDYLSSTANSFTDSDEENKAIIKTMNVQLDGLRSLVTLLQQEIDKYFD